MDYQTDFARAVGNLMGERGMTQTELASESGVSRQQLSRYLNAGAMPSLTVAVAIADALDVPVDALAHGRAVPTA